MENKGKTVYCHFSFKRPKNKPGKGYFATAIYLDYEGTILLAHKTVIKELWEDQQFVTAAQSYEYALSCIYGWQGIMKRSGITQVMLVTDNSTLAGWIENPYKNKGYTAYMQRATSMYKALAPKEIVLGVGLCEVRKYEKSYKYCKEQYVIEDETVKGLKRTTGGNVISVEQNSESVSTIYQIAMEEDEMPVVVSEVE